MFMLRSIITQPFVCIIKAAKKSAKKAKKEALKTPEKSSEEATPSKEKVSTHNYQPLLFHYKLLLFMINLTSIGCVVI